MQPDTLHDRLRAEIDRRLAVAKAATPGPWRWGPIDVTKSGKRALYCALQKPFTPGMWPGAVVLKAAEADVYPSTADAEHIALHDPADAVRRYEGNLDLLSRYDELATESVARLTQDELIERAAELRLLRELIDDLAHRLGVSVE